MTSRRTQTDEPTRTTDETGREILVYQSGAVKDAATGRFLNGPTNPQNNPVLADPKAMQKRGVELAQQKARDAIDAAVAEVEGLDLSQQSPGYGWYAVVKHVTKTLLQSNSIRGQGEVITKLGQAAGYLGRDGEPPVHAPGITAQPEKLLELMKLMEAETQARVDRAQAIEAE